MEKMLKLSVLVVVSLLTVFCVTSCTTTLTFCNTHGTADDLVDTTSKTDADLDANLSKL